MSDVTKHTFRDVSIWQEFLNHTHENVLDVNFKTREVYCSASLVRSVQLTPETLPRSLDQWLELCHPDDYSENVAFHRHVFEEKEKIFVVERRLYCGDGQYRWFRMDAVCMRDKKGKIERLIGVETDVSSQRSERQRENERLELTRGLEERLASLEEENEHLTAQLSQKNLRCKTLEKRIHLMARAINAERDLVFHHDAKGRLDFYNEAFSRAAALNPDLKAWTLALSNGEPSLDRYCEDAYGRLRHFAAHVFPFSTPHGKADGCVGIASDVTELEEMEADMARLRRLLGRNSFFYSGEENVLAASKKAVDGQERPKNRKNREKGCYSYSMQDHDLLDSSEIFGAYLKKALDALFSVSVFFPARSSQLENLLLAAGKEELEVGIVGITSSGKSTLINALMGERLLPEETRATTNLLIRCRKGEDRAMTVVSKKGERRHVTGAQLTAIWVESLASERLNPDNEQDVAFLEWTSPGAALPEGLILVDTPGLDACGFPEHSELVLRQLLPNLDIVLYITSIRNRFKTADIELLDAVLEHDQRVVFLLSQIDLEQDDVEGGRVVLSRRQKLSSYVRELRLDIENGFPKDSSIRGSAVIPISSKLAMAHFYNRDSAAWNASNFRTLIAQLEFFRSNLSRCRIEARARRALMLLSRVTYDFNLTLREISAEKAESERNARLEKIRELRDAQRWASAEISAVRNEWRRLLDPEHHLRTFRRKIENVNTVKKIKDHYDRWGEEWAQLSSQMTTRMDRARRSCRDILQKHGIVPENRLWGGFDVKNELPNFYEYVFNEAKDVQVRGWFEDLEFWPRRETFFEQNVNKDMMFSGLKDLLSERLRLLNDHLSWWENRMREDFCDPLYEELSREEVALADVRRVAADASVSRKGLLQALQDVREAERGIKNIMADLFLPEIDPEDSSIETFFDNLEDAGKKGVLTFNNAEAGEPEISENALFAPLLTAFREQSIQSRFLELDALRRHRRIVLLGLRRHDSLRLLSRLAHDAASLDAFLTEDGREIDERDWLFYGSTPPALSYVRLVLPDTFLREMEILVAPSDGLYNSRDVSGIDWNDLFAEWLPVIHLDIARIDSGLSDLARSPYACALSHVDNWIAASGQGALFNSRLSDLLTDVPDRLELFVRHQDYKGRAEWFVYENYDARYTDFMQWGHELGRNLGDEEFLRLWSESGRPFKFPFSEYRLKLALEGARRKSFRIRNLSK